MNIRKFSFYFIFIFIFILSIIEFRSFFSSGSIMRGDFVPPSPWYVQTGTWSTLNPVYFGGTINLDLSLFPISFLMSLVSQLTGAEIAYRILFILIPLIGAFSEISFLKFALQSSKLGNLEYAISGIIYAYNPWVIVEGILPGHWTMLLAYSLIPLFFLFIIKYFETKNIYSGIIASFILSIIFIIFFYFILYLLPIIFLIPLINIKKESFLFGIKNYFKILLKLFIILSISILISSYWLLPYVITLLYGNVKSPGDISAILNISKNATLVNTIRLLGYWWNPFTFNLFETNNNLFNYYYYFSSFVIPVVSIISLSFKKFFEWPTNGLRNFLLISLIFYLIISEGTNLLGNIYIYLVLKFPFLDDPTIFLSLVAFIYASSTPLVIKKILKFLKIIKMPNKKVFKINKIKVMKVFSYIILVLIISSIFTSVWPAWTGDFNGNYKPFNQPSSYSEAYIWLANHSKGARTLWLPSSGPYEEFSWSNRSVSDPIRFQTNSPILNYPAGSIISPNTTYFMETIQSLLYFGKTEYIGNLLSVANVKFLAIRTDVIPISADKQILNSTFKQKDLKLVWESGGNEKIYIFENLEPTNTISIKNNILLSYGGIKSMAEGNIFGFNISNTAYLFPETLNYTELLKFVEIPTIKIFAPFDDRLGIIASLINKTYWINLENLAQNPWFIDTWVNTNFGQLLYDGFSISSHSNNANLSIPFYLNENNITVLIRLLGPAFDYNLSIDGIFPYRSIFLTNSMGYNWAEYDFKFNNTNQIIHKINIKCKNQYYYSINSLIIVPTKTFNYFNDQIFNNISKKIIYYGTNGILYPEYGAKFVGLWNSSNTVYQPLAIEFPINNYGIASSGLPLYVKSPFSLGIYAKTINDSQESVINLHIYNYTSRQWSIIQLKNFSENKFTWISMNISIPNGTYAFYFYGKNLLFEYFYIAPFSINYFLGKIDNQNISNLVIYNPNPELYDIVTTQKGFYIVYLSNSYNNLWNGKINSSKSNIILVDAFGMGIIVNSNSNYTNNFEFYFYLQQFENIGIIVTSFTLFVSIFIIFISFHRKRKFLNLK